MTAISEDELGEIPSEIFSRNMQEIAISYLNIDSDKLDSISVAVREDQWKFNFTGLKLWKNKMLENATKEVNFYFDTFLLRFREMKLNTF